MGATRQQKTFQVQTCMHTQHAEKNYLGRGAGLLDDVLDDVVRGAATLVVDGLAVLEELEGGEAANAVLLRDVLVLVAVNLGHGEWLVGGLDGIHRRFRTLSLEYFHSIDAHNNDTLHIPVSLS